MPALGLDEYLDDVVQIFELFTFIEQGGLVEAHNVFFEYCIWLNVLQERHGWPAIPLRQWRCSAAKAAAHALPRSLEGAGEALRLSLVKDVEGAKVMKKMTKPRKSRKKEREQWERDNQQPPAYLWWESIALLDRLIDYCRHDVLSEEAISHSLDDLSAEETELFLLDLHINSRGFQLDTEAVTKAQRLLAKESVLFNEELTLLTHQQVQKATQRARMLAWFEHVGLTLYDTQKDTLDTLLTDEDAKLDLPPRVRRGLEIVRALGRSSTAKYQAMADWMGPDGRVRGGLLYHGASTGRWSGKGVQPHNFPKGTMKVDQEDLWAVLKAGTREQISERYRGVMEALSNGLRGAIIATPGKQLYVADYASIEARVLLWLANDTEALGIFERGEDIYCDMAKDIYDRPITPKDKDERSLGKIAVLGLGYQMGAKKFRATCAQFKIALDEEFAVQVVEAYRNKFSLVVEEWAAQQEASMCAVTEKNRVPCGRVTWFTKGRFLFCQLPSGRRLAYPYPQVSNQKMPWGGERPCLTYMGIDSYTRQWRRQKCYGGMLVENIVQAIARDVLAAAMQRAERAGYVILLTVHDEVIAERSSGEGSVLEFEQLLTVIPPWIRGCPIAAKGWRGTRYQKLD
jgi:DNA polymerase